MTFSFARAIEFIESIAAISQASYLIEQLYLMMAIGATWPLALQNPLNH
jgi:hypothetical protein